MDNLAFGLEITVLGMGIVFSVLILLWLLLTFALRLETRGSRHGEATPPGPGAQRETAAVAGPAQGMGGGHADGAQAGGIVRLVGAPGNLDPALVAAITVVVLRHTEALRLQAAPAMRSYWPGSLLFASRWVAAGRTRQGQSWRRRR